MHPFPFMADPVRTFITATLEEFEKILGKGVTGDPITVGDTTLIPIFVTTFGVGAGGGSAFGESVYGGGGGGVVPCAMVVISAKGVEIKHLHQDFVTSATSAQSQMATKLGNQHRGEKTEATTTTTTAAPAPAPVAAGQPAASTTSELTTVSG
jgi:uncharacterized spore protein YtfJ